MFRRKTDTEGIIIPNFNPWVKDTIRQYRIRLDNPPREPRADGTFKETQKYLQPPEGTSLLYIPRGAFEQVGADVPVILTEGEFKAIALWRLANYEATGAPRFLPIAVAGVQNWRGSRQDTDARGRRVSVPGVIPDMERFPWKGKKVIIAYDADLSANPRVKSARWALTRWLTDHGATVGHLNWDISEGKGIDDRLASVGPAPVLADIAAVEYGDWRVRLIRDECGMVRSCYDNVCLYLENDPELQGILAYNEFNAGHIIMRQPPPLIPGVAGEELTDDFDTALVRYMERKHLMVRPDQVRLAVDLVARRNSFHPVRDYLNGLPKWDGVPRIDTWLIDYCGVPSSGSSPNHYAMAVAGKFLISAVARIMQPGCKVDTMLVLEGDQGVGKSTAAQILAGEAWFTDQLAELGSKDFSMQLRGIWIAEMSELDALGRVDQSRAKAVITQQRERFRPPYGRRLINAPRQCIFLGTCNRAEWLRDETGGRRFWPVECAPIVGRMVDLAGLRRDRDQLWAEALHRYRAGEEWWITDENLIADAIEQQADRYESHPWQELIEQWLETGAAESVTIPEILEQCIGKPKERWEHRDKMTIGACLKSLGWKKRRPRTGEGRERRYFKA
jgi:predicted P-loop ATPase